MLVYQTLEKEFRVTRQINFDLQHINLELKQDVKDLKKIIASQGFRQSKSLPTAVAWMLGKVRE